LPLPLPLPTPQSLSQSLAVVAVYRKFLAFELHTVGRAHKIVLSSAARAADDDKYANLCGG